MNLQIKQLQNQDTDIIASAFDEINWHKPVTQYRRYFSEQKNGKRLVIVAWYNKKFAGYLTIVWQSKYPAFKKSHTPEIVDLNVLPKYQQRKIGTTLMNEAEKIIAKKSKTAGIGVGLAPGYEAAQVMYARRGYTPDGLGLTYKNKYLKYAL